MLAVQRSPSRVPILLLTLVLAGAGTQLVLAGPAFAIGSVDVAHLTATAEVVRFTIDNLDRTNDGDHGGYDGNVVYSTVYCYDTGTLVAHTSDNGSWNTADVVSYTTTNYDGAPHTDCAVRIYTNDGLNDYESRQRFAVPITPPAGQWTLTGTLTSFHGCTALAALHDGKVMAISGADGMGGLTSVTELFDVTAGAWTPTGSINHPRMAFHQPVVLSDGRVLVAGGHDRFVNDYASTEIYDPATGQWTFTGSLLTSRRYTVVLGLHDGRVLAATGAHGVPDGSRFLSSAELYDPATGQWTTTGSATIRRESANGIVLNDGRAMVVGGYMCCDFFTPATELYQPATGTWSLAGDRPHGGSGFALTNLLDGRVLLVGGYGPAGGAPLAEALLFDPVANQWSATAPMQLPRAGADAVALPDGRILVAGGGPVASEIYDPATSTWTVIAATNVQHIAGKMARLASGDILLAGGYTDGGFTTAAELYSANPRYDIAGTVYVDSDGSGARTLGEAGYPGATVRLYTGGGSLLQAVTTQTDGSYTFTNVAPRADSFWIWIDTPAGYLGTTRGLVSPPHLTSDVTQDFGIRAAPALPTVFTDDFTDTNGTTLAAHGAGWTTIEQGMPVLQNNMLSFPSAADPVGPTGYTMTDQCMSLDFHAPTSGIVAMHVRQDLSVPSGYATGLNTNPSYDYYDIALANANGYFPGGFAIPKPLLATGWHNFKICAIGDRISTYIDRTLMNTAIDGAWPHGVAHIGVSGTNLIDNFRLEGTTVPAGPPVYHAASNTKSASGNNNLNAAIATTGVPAGHTVAVAVATGTFAGPVGCSDSKGNSYTVAADKNTGNGRLFIYSARLTAGLVDGDVVTATYPAFSGVSVISVNAIANTVISGIVEQTNVNAGNNPNPTSGNVTTSQPNAVIFGVVAHNSTPTFTPGTGFTLIGAVSGGSGSGQKTLSPEFKVVTTAGTHAATATLSSGQQWRAAVIAYR